MQYAWTQRSTYRQIDEHRILLKVGFRLLRTALCKASGFVQLRRAALEHASHGSYLRRGSRAPVRFLLEHREDRRRAFPCSRHWPLCPRPFRPFCTFLGPCKTLAPSSSSCAARSCRSRRCRSCEARRRSASTRICDCWRRRCPRRTAPAPRAIYLDDLGRFRKA